MIEITQPEVHTSSHVQNKSDGPHARRAPLPPHITALDGIRGLAILLVLIYHFTMMMPAHTIVERFLLKLTTIGWCGVNLFFVLSGFLITGILYDTKDHPYRYRNFYARRALRIFPLYYGTLIAVFAALALIRSNVVEWEGLHDAQIWLWAYGTNIYVALRSRWFPLSHFWSLAVEEHFYLLWPMIIFGLSRRASQRVCGALVILALASRLWFVTQGAALSAYCLTFCRMDSLAIGGFVALAARDGYGLARFAPLARRLLMVSGTGLTLLIVWRRGLSLFDPATQTIGYLLLDLCFASLIVLVVASSPDAPLPRLFECATLRKLGRYSYGLYVYNSLVIVILDQFKVLKFISNAINSRLLAQLIFASTAFIATFTIAWTSWRFFESLFLKYKSYFT